MRSSLFNHFYFLISIPFPALSLSLFSSELLPDTFEEMSFRVWSSLVFLVEWLDKRSNFRLVLTTWQTKGSSMCDPHFHSFPSLASSSHCVFSHLFFFTHNDHSNRIKCPLNNNNQTTSFLLWLFIHFPFHKLCTDNTHDLTLHCPCHLESFDSFPFYYHYDLKCDIKTRDSLII